MLDILWKFVSDWQKFINDFLLYKLKGLSRWSIPVYTPRSGNLFTLLQLHLAFFNLLSHYFSWFMNIWLFYIKCAYKQLFTLCMILMPNAFQPRHLFVCTFYILILYTVCKVLRFDYSFDYWLELDCGHKLYLYLNLRFNPFYARK